MKKKPKWIESIIFLLSYAQTFKTFPPRKQSMAKLEMAFILARYELQVAEGSDASASRVAHQSVNQRSCSSTQNSESVPNPYDHSSNSWAVPSPVSQQFPEPANASNQENRVFYVLPSQSTPTFQTASTPQPQLTGNLTEYYEHMSYSLDNSIN